VAEAPRLSAASARALGVGEGLLRVLGAPEQERGASVSVLSAFYDVFVGMSSFSAGLIAHAYGYAAAFIMAIASVGVAAIAGRAVFKPSDHFNPESAAAVLETEV